MKIIKILNRLLGLLGIVLIVTGIIEIFKGDIYFESFVLGFLFVISSQLGMILEEK